MLMSEQWMINEELWQNLWIKIQTFDIHTQKLARHLGQRCKLNKRRSHNMDPHEQGSPTHRHVGRMSIKTWNPNPDGDCSW